MPAGMASVPRGYKTEPESADRADSTSMAFRKTLALLPLSLLAAGRMPVHERREVVPAGFVSQGAAPATEMLTLRIALASSNVAGLEARLMSIATPGSPDFRKWLSKDEVKRFVQPAPQALSAFTAFASANGLEPTVISPNGDWLSVTLPVSKANKLFAAKYETFTHASLKRPVTRTLSVSLPSELVGHVEVLHPSTSFLNPTVPLPLAQKISTRGKRAVEPSCDSDDPHSVVTPTCLQELYGIPKTPATQPGNTLLVTSYEEQWAKTADLQTFLELMRPDMDPSTTFTLLTLDNGTNPQGPDNARGEGNLDIQYTAGIATGVPVQFLSVGDGVDFPTALLDTNIFLDGVDDLPSVLSMSYANDEATVGLSMATKICNGYMALGARGMSVVVASGDGGVHGGHDGVKECTNNTFLAVFPASCPYATAVGGTQSFAPERAINFTSGGFSAFFPAPAYQAAATKAFLAALPPDFPGVFDRGGRGFPDVAAQAWNYGVVMEGNSTVTGGTSAATPLFASVIALINDRLLAAGRPVLGFLNPFLYSTASSTFTDVTAGHNAGYHCTEDQVAFDAGVGWDPLTGFGTPVFDALLAAAMA